MKSPSYLSQALLGAFVFFTIGATGWGAASTVESPVGEFRFNAPDDPPSGPALITPMAFINGPYNDSTYFPGATTFLTMDAAGKVMAVSQVPGFVDKKEGSSVTRTLFVRTVNGVPILTANAAAGGMYTDGISAPTAGKGKATIPLGPASASVGNVQQVTVMSSFSGKRANDVEKEPLQMSTLDLDVNQLGDIVTKSWGMDLNISQVTGPKGISFVAGLYLDNPNGTRTFFAQRAVKYSATAGYTITFSKGYFVNSSNAPILEGGRRKIDKNSQIKFSNLLFKKQFDSNDIPFWEPAAGGVSFKFLGQNGFGQVFNFDISLFTASARGSSL